MNNYLNKRRDCLWVRYFFFILLIGFFLFQPDVSLAANGCDVSDVPAGYVIYDKGSSGCGLGSGPYKYKLPVDGLAICSQTIDEGGPGIPVGFVVASVSGTNPCSSQVGSRFVLKVPVGNGTAYDVEEDGYLDLPKGFIATAFNPDTPYSKFSYSANADGLWACNVSKSGNLILAPPYVGVKYDGDKCVKGVLAGAYGGYQIKNIANSVSQVCSTMSDGSIDLPIGYVATSFSGCSRGILLGEGSGFKISAVANATKACSTMADGTVKLPVGYVGTAYNSCAKGTGSIPGYDYKLASVVASQTDKQICDTTADNNLVLPTGYVATSYSGCARSILSGVAGYKISAVANATKACSTMVNGAVNLPVGYVATSYNSCAKGTGSIPGYDYKLASVVASQTDKQICDTTADNNLVLPTGYVATSYSGCARGILSGVAGYKIAAVTSGVTACSTMADGSVDVPVGYVADQFVACAKGSGGIAGFHIVNLASATKLCAATADPNAVTVPAGYTIYNYSSCSKGILGGSVSGYLIKKLPLTGSEFWCGVSGVSTPVGYSLGSQNGTCSQLDGGSVPRYSLINNLKIPVVSEEPPADVVPGTVIRPPYDCGDASVPALVNGAVKNTACAL